MVSPKNVPVETSPREAVCWRKTRCIGDPMQAESGHLVHPASLMLRCFLCTVHIFEAPSQRNISTKTRATTAAQESTYKSASHSISTRDLCKCDQHTKQRTKISEQSILGLTHPPRVTRQSAADPEPQENSLFTREETKGRFCKKKGGFGECALIPAFWGRGISKIIAFFCQGSIAGKDFLEEISAQGNICQNHSFGNHHFANPRFSCSLQTCTLWIPEKNGQLPERKPLLEPIVRQRKSSIHRRAILWRTF